MSAGGGQDRRGVALGGSVVGISLEKRGLDKKGRREFDSVSVHLVLACGSDIILTNYSRLHGIPLILERSVN